MRNKVSDGIMNTIVFGELMFNDNIHDHSERGMVGRWILFGCILVIEDDEKMMEEIIENLRVCGFGAKK